MATPKKRSSRKSRKSRSSRKSTRRVATRKSRFSRKSRRRNFNLFAIEQNLEMNKPFVAEFHFVGKTAAGNASDKTWTIVSKGGKTKVMWGKSGGGKSGQTVGKAEALRRASEKLGKGYKLVDLS
jgi:hypothetical protein